MSEAAPVTTWFERDAALLRLRLARPKANIIDSEMIAALDGALAQHGASPALRAVLIDHEGPNFSFGASVQEHLPAWCAAMLRDFHALIGRLLDCPVPVLVAVRGQCLGGGLEIAVAAGRIFAAPDACFGQPEIRLAVFAPAASCLLPERIGQARAEDLLYSGRSVDAEAARAMGLVDTIAGDPARAALDYAEAHLLPHSASSLRFAVRAARAGYAARLKERLREVEELYLGGLMATRDASEGLEAFLAKRPARWEHR